MSADRSSRFEPGKLWSLWDIMQTFDASQFFALAGVLGNFTSRRSDDPEVVDKEWCDANVPALKEITTVLWGLSMDASHASLARLIDILESSPSTHGSVSIVASELQGRLRDQARHCLFFALNLKESDFATRPYDGWETSLERFPAISQDVQEAGVCLALSRFPASVYHSVQVAEIGLVELGKFLKVNDPHSGWTAVTNALQKAIDKKHSDRTPFEKKHFASLEQIHGTVEALKNAWRNKISHVQRRLVLLKTDFGVERTEEILLATRAFMRRLAEDIPPPKQRRKKRLSEIDIGPLPPLYDSALPINPADDYGLPDKGQ